MSESLPPSRAKPLSPWRSLIGALLAGSLALPIAKMTQLIARSFADHPFASDNQTAMKISIALRTLVVGLSTLATGIFSMAALGLLALSVQLLWQRLRSATEESEKP